MAFLSFFLQRQIATNLLQNLVLLCAISKDVVPSRLKGLSVVSDPLIKPLELFRSRLSPRFIKSRGKETFDNLVINIDFCKDMKSSLSYKSFYVDDRPLRESRNGGRCGKVRPLRCTTQLKSNMMEMSPCELLKWKKSHFSSRNLLLFWHHHLWEQEHIHSHHNRVKPVVSGELLLGFWWW